MLPFFVRGLSAAALAVAAGTVLAAAAAAPPPPPASAPSGRTDPSDPAATVPPLRFRSALQDYQRWADPPAVDWRTHNETAARIGGWRAYLREATAPEPAASAASAASAPAMPPAHGHHDMQHGGTK